MTCNSTSKSFDTWKNASRAGKKVHIHSRLGILFLTLIVTASSSARCMRIYFKTYFSNTYMYVYAKNVGLYMHVWGKLT
jgi:hypothetical protein